jgi:diguanylate cyclase
MATGKPRGMRFVKRVYPARVLGLGLGGLSIGAALLHLQPSPLLWVVLVCNCLVWPHLAHFTALRSSNPHRFERRYLVGDSVMGGFWIAAMGFNPLASSIVAMMLGINNIAAGGGPLFARGFVGAVFGLLVGLSLFGLHWHSEVNMTLVYAAIPMLVVYPAFIGSIAYRLAMQLHGQKELLQQISRTDALTGLYNRGYWETRTKEEIVRARRNHTQVSLIILDVDHFKLINDTYGHAVGDQVLQQLSKYLAQNVRENEILGRYGGEEFALVLPGSSKAEAVQTAERLREIIDKAEFQDTADPHSAKLHCTISLGVAAYNDGLGDFSSWIRLADNALYQAKGQGRNRVVAYRQSQDNLASED